MSPLQMRIPGGRKTRRSRMHRMKLDLEALEERTLLSFLLGEGGRRDVRFLDARGALVSMKLQGPGSAVVTLQGDATTRADLQSLDLRGTDPHSRLIVRVVGDVVRPPLTGAIDVDPGGLGALVVRGALASSLFSRGPIGSIESGAIRRAVIASTSDIGRIGLAGRVVSSTILAGMDMAGDLPGDGDGVPGPGRIGRVRIGGGLGDSTIAAGVAPGPDGRFGTADDIASVGPTSSRIGPVTVGGRFFGGRGAEAAVVIAAADRTPKVYHHGTRFAGTQRVRLVGPIANSQPAPSSAIDPIDRSQLVNVNSRTRVHDSGIFNDIRTRRSTINVQVTDTSSAAIPTPLILVVESISDPTVTVANADGILTPNGKPFFNLTGQVPGTSLNPGATTSNRPIVFNNPLLHTFTITTSVNYEITQPARPTVTLGLPADSQGRHLIGIADAPSLSGSPGGVTLTVTASGTAPVTVNLGQSPAGAGSRGAVFFGATGTAATATVTTSGGANNVARILVRGDSSHPSAYQGDLDLIASIGGTPMAAQLVTVFRIAPDSTDKDLVNDAVVPVTLTTTPAISGLVVTFQPVRGTISGNQIAPPLVAAPSEFNIFPAGGGSTVRTGADGTANFSVQQGNEGEGFTAALITADDSTGQSTDGKTELSLEGTAPCCCCGNPSSSPQAKSDYPLELYSGEESLTTTDLTIPGRGFDFTLTRTYRSQVSELRPIDTNDLGVDWGFNYSDDRLLPDSNNVILFSPTMRTDTFMATSTPGVYTAPMGFFDQLTVDGSGDFELRDNTGMVKTYASFRNPSIPGRLISESDPEGDLMTFHYARIDPDNTVPGDQKFVLSYAIDTLGREIRFQYYARTSQSVDGRVVTVTDPAGNTASFGRLAHVIDFKGDMTFDGSDASADFAGQTNNRTLTFTYDTEGNLVSETSPVVTGTPDGNDFPDGKTTRYDYTREVDIPATIAGLDRERLLHNLAAIEAPNEAASDPADTTGLANPRVTFTYGNDPADPATFDRVIAVTEGGTNINGVPAGGTIRYSYRIVATGARTTNDPYLQTTATDRNGNVSQYVYSPYDTLLSQAIFTAGLRAGEPTSYVTTYKYDNDKMLIRDTMPDGNTITYIHDHLNPDRLEQDNLLRTIEAPDAARGGDQSQIATATVYEPIYQHPAVVTDPRGLDPSYLPPVADPSGRTPFERYSTYYYFDYQESPEKAAQAPTDRIDKDGSGGRVNQSPLIAVDPNVLTVEVWLMQISRLPQTAAGLATLRSRLAKDGIRLGLGDLNGDGDTTPQVDGNIERIVQPSVVLLPGSNEAAVEGSQLQPVVTLMRYNQFGQLTSEVDPEGNVTVYTYYSERDPDGDGVPTPTPADGRTLDPNTGGYLEETAVDTTSSPGRDSGTDPTPADITTSYSYDDVGNKTSITDGRGITSDYFVNELNQVVQTTTAAAVPASGPGHPSEPLPLTAFAYIHQNFYDYNNNIVINQTEDRGNTSGVDGNPPADDLPTWVPGASDSDHAGGTAFVDTVNEYDILDQPIEMLQEVSNGAAPVFLDTLYRHDPDGNTVLTIQPEGNATSSFYDERNLLFQSTTGATSPPPRALLAAGDPTDYKVRGGLPATTTDNYDPNGNLVETVAAADEDLSAANNSKTAGGGDRTRYVYDGFDRRTAVVDSVGDETVTQYDPAGNVVRTAEFGPGGGPSPTSDGPDVLPGPVSSLGVIQAQNLVDSELLAATETSYDELSRPFQTAQVLLVNTIPTARIPDVAEGGTDVGLGDLNPGAAQPIPGVVGVAILGRVTDRTEYDRDSRKAFTIGDAGETSRTLYDGVGRVVETVDPAGNTVETAYDADSNVIETRQTDVAQVPGVAPEVFLTTNFYDSLDRLQEAVDNQGETTDYRYDSRDNLVAMADAQGPVTGQMIARRAFPDGPRTVDAINGFGNVTLYFYDGQDRQTRIEQILTASGDGDGTHIGASIEGVKDDPTAPESFPPAADPSQGGGDGIIRTGTVWDGDSLQTALIDDSGNVTLSLYDDLDRQVLQSEGLVVGFAYTEANILGARVIPTPTAATIDNPTTISDAGITARLAEARSRIAAVSSLFPPLADQVDDSPPTTKVWGYDPNGDALITQDEDGSETFIRFDAINRPIAVRIFRAGQSDSFAGDPTFAPAPSSIPAIPGNVTVVQGTNIQNFQYDGLSRTTYAFDNNDPTTAADDSTVTDAYDSLGRVVEEGQTIGGQPTQVISSAWRADDLRAALTYPNGRVEAYTYDNLDRLKTVSDQGAALPIAVYDYIGVDRVLERLYPQNGTLETFLDDSGTVDIGYDGDRRPIEERDLEADGSLIVGFTDTYDRMGDKLTEGKLHDPANSETYTYDSAYRLLTFNRAPGGIAPAQTSWSLDSVGNAVQVDGQSQQFSSTNELIQSAAATGGPATVLYDNNGNETDDGTYLYTYDAENRLRTVALESNGELIAVYSYDARGRRIEKVVTNSGGQDGTTDFSYDGWQDIEERDGSGALAQQYVYGAYLDEPLVMDRNLGGGATATGPGDQRLFYNQNAMYSVYALTDVSGKILEAYQYDAYGKATVFTGPGPDGTWFTGDEPTASSSAVANPFTFTGQRLDAESGLMDYKNRYLDVDQGRFLQRDPSSQPDQTNAYEYVQGQPTGLVDPLGLKPCLPKFEGGDPDFDTGWIDTYAGYPILGNFFGTYWDGSGVLVIDSKLGSCPNDFGFTYTVQSRTIDGAMAWASVSGSVSCSSGGTGGNCSINPLITRPRDKMSGPIVSAAATAKILKKTQDCVTFEVEGAASYEEPITFAGGKVGVGGKKIPANANVQIKIKSTALTRDVVGNLTFCCHCCGG